MIARGGIDLGGTKIQTVVVNGRWRGLGQARRPTPTTGGPEDVAPQMVEAMREAAQAAGVDTHELGGRGVGSAGGGGERPGGVAKGPKPPRRAGTVQLRPG